MEETPYQPESITITLPKTMPYGERVSEVGRRISEWLKSIERPFNYRTNSLRLKRCEKTKNEFIYRYEIHSKEER
jgi:hypothetical protein